ncbi:hypothetical protein MY3296_006965 [Beauveria thailandica]
MARPQLMSQAVESELQVAVQVTLQIICAALHVSQVAEEPATSAGAQIRFQALAHAADLAILRQDMGRRGKLAARPTVDQTLAMKNGTPRL